MEIGSDLIVMVKTNTNRFFKDTIGKLTKDCPGGSYLVFRIKSMVPGDRPIIGIGYKYNAQKFLSFIVTDNSDITKTIIHYLSKYPDQFTNFSIRPIACPLVMSKTFCC